MLDAEDADDSDDRENRETPEVVVAGDVEAPATISPIELVTADGGFGGGEIQNPGKSASTERDERVDQARRLLRQATVGLKREISGEDKLELLTLCVDALSKCSYLSLRSHLLDLPDMNSDAVRSPAGLLRHRLANIPVSARSVATRPAKEATAGYVPANPDSVVRSAAYAAATKALIRNRLASRKAKAALSLV